MMEENNYQCMFDNKTCVSGFIILNLICFILFFNMTKSVAGLIYGEILLLHDIFSFVTPLVDETFIASDIIFWPMSIVGLYFISISFIGLNLLFGLVPIYLTITLKQKQITPKNIIDVKDYSRKLFSIFIKYLQIGSLFFLCALVADDPYLYLDILGLLKGLILAFPLLFTLGCLRIFIELFIYAFIIVEIYFRYQRACVRSCNDSLLDAVFGYYGEYEKKTPLELIYCWVRNE